jgi:ketosteroid isomerase-like protein
MYSDPTASQIELTDSEIIGGQGISAPRLAPLCPETTGPLITFTKEVHTMNEKENIQLVQRTYQLFKSGDINTLLSLYSDDVKWHIPKMENVPYSGEVNGIQKVRDFFALLAENEENLTFDTREFIAQGDKVVVLGHFSWRIKATNNKYDSDFAHVVNVKNGKISGFHEYVDTAARIRAHTGAKAAR